MVYGNSTQKPLGRGIRMESPLNTDCLCSRPSRTILCNVCGYMMRGRLRRVCKKHPLTMFLMDVERCPRCKSYAFMMQEVD